MKKLGLIFLALVLLNQLGLSQFTDAQIKEFVESASEQELVERNTILLTDGFFINLL